MNKRILSLAVSSVMLFSVALAGCGSTTDSAATPAPAASSAPVAEATKAPAKQVTIKFGIEATNEKLIKDFEAKNPDIKIQMVTVGSESEKLMSMLAAGTAPDLIRLTGAIALPGYVTKGIALNLDSYFAKSEVLKADDMLPICNVYRFDGKKVGTGSIYGLPKDWSNDTGLFANKKAFEKAGVPVPSTDKPMTYSELFKISKDLTKFDAKGKATSVGVNIGAVVNYQTILYQLATMGKSLWSDDLKTSRWTDEDVKALVKQWIDARMDKSLNSPLWEAGPVSFSTDTQAMENWGYWATGMYRGDDKLKSRIDTDVIALPSPYADGGKPAAACTYATGGIINAKTKNPDQAFRVFEWYFGKEPAEDRAKSGWGLPVLKHLQPMIPKDTAFDKQVNAVMDRELANLVYITVNPYLSGTYETVITKYLEPVLFGKVKLDDALKQLKDETDKLITEGMEVAGLK